jgi:hypothetical protein
MTTSFSLGGVAKVSSRERYLDLLLIFVLGFSGLIALMFWLDNAEGITGNGVFKAIQAKPWIAKPSTAPLDPSNFLYFPFVGVFCQLLDWIGVFTADPRRQLSVINSFSAALCLCIVYTLVRELTQSRLVAWSATLFHLSGAFFLNLAISNEDIMPSYTLLFASMALASVWFVDPTRIRVCLVAVLFTVAWLFEWRLMFPTLPAMLIALAVGPGPMLQRLGRIALFLATMVAFTWAIMSVWGPQPNNVSSVFDLLWTGKGINSGWSGFDLRKIGFLWIGISEYLTGGHNISELGIIYYMLKELILTCTVILILAACALAILWRHRRAVDARVLAVVFGVTFGAGEFLNSYAQPQDPQMRPDTVPFLLSPQASHFAFRCFPTTSG